MNALNQINDLKGRMGQSIIGQQGDKAGAVIVPLGRQSTKLGERRKQAEQVDRFRADAAGGGARG